MVKNITFNLYPQETVSLEIEVDEHGRLVKGPVMWTMDTGQGRLANLADESWDEWALKMINRGVIINGLLPNSTTVLAIMDELFRAFKADLRSYTHDHYARKIKANSKAIVKRKLEIARKIAVGELVTEAERAKTRSVVGLNPMDLGPILFGKLTENGYADPKSPIATAFTKEKILESHDKVFY